MLLTALIFVLAGMLTLHTYAEAEDPGAQEIQSDIQAEEMAEQEVPQQEEENLEPEPILPDNSEQDPGESLPEEEEPAVQDGWHIDGTDRYYIENGEYIKNNPHKEIDGVWYRFDEEGRAFEANIYTAGDTPFGTGDRVWFYNVSGGSFGSDMILVESGGRFGLIDAGNRYAETIEDADGTTYTAPANSQLSSQTEGKNGKDGMIYLVKTLGVEHLDFIIGTHAHSDHIGGIPEIAALQVYGKDGLFHYLVDETTVYLYKNYQHISSQEDDLGEKQGDSWHNQAFTNAALQAVKDRGGAAVDLSCGLTAAEGGYIHADYTANLQLIEKTRMFENVSYEPRSATDPFDDRLRCRWGNFVLDFYNLFSVKGATEENVNSIVTVITANGHKIYLGGDIDTLHKTEQKIASVIAKDHGTMDVAKASHHGFNFSNSQTWADLLRPRTVVVTGSRTNSREEAPSDCYQSFKYYANKHFGTAFYEIGASGRMLVINLGKAVSVNAVDGEGAQARLLSAQQCKESARPADGWSRWDQELGNSSETKWYYFENGVPATGWKSIDGCWYYFEDDGFMVTNCWKRDSVGWCYLGSSGAMLRNTWCRDSSGWCWLNGSGYWESSSKWVLSEGEWYYIGSNGYLTTNAWAKDSVGWCYLGADGRIIRNAWERDSHGWCYLGADGYMTFSRWIRDGGEWYYLNANGYMAANAWARDSYGWCWMTGNGRMMKSQWLYTGGSWYYLNADGYMVTGTRVIGGKTYRFATSGKWIG